MRKSSKLVLILALIVCAFAKSDYKVVNTVRNTSSVTLTLSYTGSESYYIK